MPIDPTSMQALLSRLEAAREVMASVPARMEGAAGAAKAGAAGAKAVDFGAMLKASINRVDQSQTDAYKLADRFQLGDPKVTLEETMVSLSKANLSFQQAVQVRNRLVQAYHDVMNLQI